MPKIRSTLLTEHIHQRKLKSNKSATTRNPEKRICLATCLPCSEDVEQTGRWFDEALQRATGRHILQRPELDFFQARGRTIYDAGSKPRRFQPHCEPSPLVVESKTIALNIGRRRSLLDETVHQTECGKALRSHPSLHTISADQPSQGADIKKFFKQEKKMGPSKSDDYDAWPDTSSDSVPSLIWSQSTLYGINDDYTSSFSGSTPLEHAAVYQELEGSRFDFIVQTADDLFDTYINTACCAD